MDTRAVARGRWRDSRAALQVFTAFERSKISPWIWVVLIWLVLIIPAITLRGVHYEEGTVIALARGAVEDGYWLVPHHYGLRFAERPALMSWVIAALGMPFGAVNQWIARVPAVLSLLLAGALVFHLVRKQAGVLAALFGAVCFFVCPAILQKLVTAEPDVMLSALLFAAFVLWWGGHAEGRVSALRWFGIGLVLAAAALTKGPQPLAYFTLGIGAFLVLQRRWGELPGFIVANGLAGAVVLAWYLAVREPGDLALWAHYGRLNVNTTMLQWTTESVRFAVQFALELLPGLILSVPLAVLLVRSERLRSEELALALVLYAACCTAVLLVWPGGVATRYAMPAVPAMAAFAGLAFDRYRHTRPQLVDAALAVAACVGAYQLIVNWLVMPLLPAPFQNSRLGAQAIVPVIEAAPAPLYATFETLNNNLAAYLPPPIRNMPLAELAKMPTPAWALLTPEEVRQLQAMRPDLKIALRAIVHEHKISHLVELRK